MYSLRKRKRQRGLAMCRSIRQKAEETDTSNNSSPSLIVTLTPTGCMMPWSQLGGVFQVYIKFLH